MHKVSHLMLGVFLAGSLLFGGATNLTATTYFVHPLQGKDTNEGTCQAYPFKSLSRLNSVKLLPGDAVLLSTEGIHHGSLELDGACGTATRPIRISAYDRCAGERKLAKINAADHLAAIFLRNCSDIAISRLKITANGREADPMTREEHMRCGVLIWATGKGSYGNIHLEQVHIRDVFFYPEGGRKNQKKQRADVGKRGYGYGIRVICKDQEAQLKNISITQCTVENVSHTGIKFTGDAHRIADVDVSQTIVTRTGGPGMQFGRIQNGHIRRNHISYSGSDGDPRNRKRGSGLWTWDSERVLVEKNSFLYANGPADSAGAHIDFLCTDVIMQYNFSAYNAGGFCEILGNCHNCAYRYNVSVNDGHRVNKVHGAFQDGKILWTSGFTGKDGERGGPFSCYIYNNTIYTDQDHVARIFFEDTTAGLLVANNIFYLKGPCEKISRQGGTPKAGAKDLFVQNNLFLSTESWDEVVPYADAHPLTGEPGFRRCGGLAIEDYRPRNTAVVKDRGISIRQLQGSDRELMGGMNPAVDILGRRIEGQPDLGAIEAD